MPRLLIVFGVLFLLAGAGFLFLFGDQLASHFSAEGRRDRTLRRLNNTGTLVRRSCGLGEAHVDGGRWSELTAADQERAAAAIASWCAEQGGATTLTVFDGNSRVTLARWNGTTLERPGR